MFWKPKGAYTSQISLPMLADVGVQYVILGHSETRGRFGVAEPDLTPDLMRAFGETDHGVNVKAKAVLAAGLIPIVCIGETLTERQNGHTDTVVQHQVAGALEGHSRRAGGDAGGVCLRTRLGHRHGRDLRRR